MPKPFKRKASLPFKKRNERRDKHRPPNMREQDNEILGAVHFTERGPILIPLSKRHLGMQWRLLSKGLPELKEGELIRTLKLERAQRDVFYVKFLAKLTQPAVQEDPWSFIALETHQIPYVFPQAVILETKTLSATPKGAREDWRHMPFVTIDPADARDRDDAVYAEPHDNGGFVLYVAIADVAAYVTPESAIDHEALNRGNSVYFPNSVVPMLPERLSNELCSLTANKDRPALAARLILTAQGDVISHSFHRVLIHCHAQLSYEKAQSLLDAKPIKPPLADLWRAYEALRHAREKRSPLDLNLPERKIHFNEKGEIDHIDIPPRLDAHRLIEECMIAANVAAAQTLEAKSVVRIYRTHEAPSPEKIPALRDTLKSLGISFSLKQTLRPQIFNQVLEQVKDTAYEHMVNEMILRLQAQAEYQAKNTGHFGLHLQSYTHFTSPIRRYSDLLVHRALIAAHGWETSPLPSQTEHAEMATHLSQTERRAMAAERETKDRYIAHYLSEQIGATFHARISGLTRAGVFVELHETGADGFIPASSLMQHHLKFNERQKSYAGRRKGQLLRIGDRVEVRLLEAHPLAGALRFELAEE